MLRRTLMAVAAVGLLTTIATAPAFAGGAGTVQQIGGKDTLTHQLPDRQVQGQLGRPKFEDMKLGTGMSRNGGSMTTGSGSPRQRR